MNKNHIQLLNEYGAKQGFRPHFVYEQQQAVPIPRFLAKCTFTFRGRRYDATGIGQKKKDAQLEAAKSMFMDHLNVPENEPEAYSMLRTSTSENKQASDLINTEAASIRNLVEEAYPEAAKNGNPIEDLAILCETKELVLPDYTDEACEGPSHCPVFTVKCKAGDTERLGKCKTKKLAKRAAAYYVLTEMKRKDSELLAENNGVGDLQEIEEMPQMMNLLKINDKGEGSLNRTANKTYDDYFRNDSIKSQSKLAEHLSKQQGETLKELIQFSAELDRNEREKFHVVNPETLYKEWLRKHEKGPTGFFVELKKELKFEEKYVISEPSSSNNFMVSLIVTFPSDAYQDSEPTSVQFGDNLDTLAESCKIEIITHLGTQSVMTLDTPLRPF